MYPLRITNIDLQLNRRLEVGDFGARGRPFGDIRPDCIGRRQLCGANMAIANIWAKNIERWGLAMLMEWHAHDGGFDVDSLKETCFIRVNPWKDETFGGVVARGPYV